MSTSLLAVFLVAALVFSASADSPPPALPEGDRGIAAAHAGDVGIDKDPAVLFHDDFETGHPREKWDRVFQEKHVRVTEEPAHVAHGIRAVEFTVPKQRAELSNALVKKLEPGRDVVFLRYYTKFDPGFDPRRLQSQRRPSVRPGARRAVRDAGHESRRAE